MKAFYPDQQLMPMPAGQRFPSGKYRLLRERVARDLPQIATALAPPASDGELALVHQPAYIRALSEGSISAAAMREIGFPWSAQMLERARRSVGATVAACRTALREGIAANMAGGSHHASADKGSGYCVFNDVAVAARLMQAEWGRSRSRPLQVAVLDLDVHQGNGTAAIFSNDASVFTLSLHAAKNFPFRKERSDLDVELPDGCADEAYLQALEQALDELEARFTPDLLIFLAGADPFEGDRLGRLKLSFDGLEARDRRVFDWAWQRRLPLAFAMAGGYGIRVEDTVRVQLKTFELALSYWRRWATARAGGWQNQVQ